MTFFKSKDKSPPSTTTASCLGDVIMLSIRSRHKTSAGSSYSIERTVGSLLAEQNELTFQYRLQMPFLNLPVDSVASRVVLV